MSTELKDATAAPSRWEQATLFINGKKVEWRAELVLLRGQENEVTVEAPPVIARALNLGLADNGGLETVASPEFGAWVAPVNGKFTWKITPDTGKSGRITLVFFSREVLVPWEHRSLVISSNLADEVEVKIGGQSVPASGNVFIRGQAQEVTLVPKPGSPIAGHNITLTYKVLQGLFQGDIRSTPPFGGVGGPNWRWQLTGFTRSGTFEISVVGQGMSTPIKIAVSKLLSNNLADEADVKIDGATVPAGGNWFYRDKAQTVTLTPKPNSPLAGLPVTLTCAIKSGLDVANVVSAPAFGSEPTTYSWAVTGNTKSGTFQLALSGKGMTTPITLPVSKLLSSNLADEADVTIADAAVPVEGNWFYRNSGRMVTLTPKPNSPLAGLPVTLTWTIKSGLANDSVVSQPAFGTEQTTYSWAVMGRVHSGTFQLALVGKGMSTPITLAVSKLVSRDLRDEVEVKIGGQSVPASGNVFIRGQAQEVTLVPKPRSPIAGHNITLTCQPLQGLSEGDIQSAPPFGGIGGPNWRWQVTGYNRSGTFQISVVGAGGVINPLKIAVSKLI
ncbi:hypothetical protein AB4Z35_07585 [Pseudomonas sp. KB_15]|uniref:hypothetical protein n=1 Tax=Pseudomonas sp. KB_15 TaxID=3233035 RepID=UPI003F963F0B